MHSDSIDVHARFRLSKVINASGTMTSIGSSAVVPEAVAAGTAIQPHFVSMAQLYARASDAIALATGAEAGFVTACSAAGITLAVAATMTGADLAAIERLPDVTSLKKSEVILQAGHCINYGAPVEQAIRLAGARVVVAGSATHVQPYHLEASIASATAAILHVVSHHVVQEGQTSIDEVIAIGRSNNIPVIVDMASEYDLTGPIAKGATIAIYSAHKFLGGPTAGIVAGRRDLIGSCYLQNSGIGRTMKVGKEGIIGTIAALEAWQRRDHAAIRERELAILLRWEAALARINGLRSERVPDWTGNPIERLKVTIGAGASLFAWELADRLAAREPAIYVRDDLVEHGTVYLDPCNVRPDEVDAVSSAIVDVIEAARRSGDGCRMTLGEWRRLQSSLTPFD